MLHHFITHIKDLCRIQDEGLYLVVMHDPLRHRFVQHLLIPLLQSFGLWDLLIDRVTVEDVVVPLAGWAGPDMTGDVADGNGRRCKKTEKESKMLNILQEKMKMWTDHQDSDEHCVWEAARTPTSSRTPSSQWEFHGRRLFLRSEVGRSGRCPGRKCIRV